MNNLLYLILFLALCFGLTVGFGHYMALVFSNWTQTKKQNWLLRLVYPVEQVLLNLSGVSTPSSMLWQQYTRHFLLFNLFVGILAFLVLIFQNHLPLNPLNYPAVEPWLAFNTICSFITNTNWQSYSGEATLTNLSQMVVITSSMVIGAGSGVAVGIAFLRGLTNRPLGNFYQDFIRTVFYLFLPILVAGSLFFVWQGVPQTLTQQVTSQTVEGASQKIALGPVASLLTIKQLGTNGGGFYNANSAHPYENPNGLTNLVEILLELAIPMGFVYLFGIWLNDRKQGWLIWWAMMTMMLLFFAAGFYFEQQPNPVLAGISSIHVDLSPGNLEGKELRFGLLPAMLFTTVTTATSTGAVNNMHDSLSPVAGMIPIVDMMLNVIFGGVGVGIMNFLLYGIIAVFLTGLMVGRTPEIFGKKIEKPEIILASIAILLHPLLILLPTAIAAVNDFGLSSLNNAGPHGLSEILYAYTSAAANNGSAFAGLNANTPWYNISIGLVILLGRYISIIALLAIAGSLLAKPKMEAGPGTLKTNTVLFTCVWVGVILIVGALTFVPVLVLGPIAEHLALYQGQLY